MAIYTKTGDKGITSIFGGKRVSKDDLIIESCGSIDELSSFIGFSINNFDVKNEKQILLGIQKNLYLIMAYLSGAKVDIKHLNLETKKFEQIIDKYTTELPKLNRFVLNPGTKIASFFHILRTETRKCERQIIRYLKASNKLKRDTELQIMMYINRMSDLFFTFSRKYSNKKEILSG